MSVLRQHMEAMIQMRMLMSKSMPKGYNFWCLEDFVLDHGREYVSRPATDEQRQAIFEVTDTWGLDYPKQMCFGNCQEVALMGGPRFTYVEGYSYFGFFPFSHAWIEVDDGVVFDPTLRIRKPKTTGRFHDRVIGEWDDVREYFGVRFTDIDFIRETVLEEMAHVSLLDNWKNGYPLLKEQRHGPEPKQSLAAPWNHLSGQGS